MLVPQEEDNGILNISIVGQENIDELGKRIKVHHMQADSGLLQIDLWVDDNRILHKIAVPSKGIEVIRVPR